MNITYYKTSELVPYKNNPRKNDEAVDAVAESIKEFGFKVPIIVDKNNIIVAGHTRLKAAQKLGLKSVPVVCADDLSEEQVKAFRLADNKTAELAHWDFSKLEEEVAKIKDIDLNRFGFREFEKKDIAEFIEESEDSEDKEQKPIPIKCPYCGTVFDVRTMIVIKESEVEDENN